MGLIQFNEDETVSIQGLRRNKVLNALTEPFTHRAVMDDYIRWVSDLRIGKYNIRPSVRFSGYTLVFIPQHQGPKEKEYTLGVYVPTEAWEEFKESGYKEEV